MIELPAELATARLRIRRPTLDDAPVAFERWCRDPEVTRHLTWRAHTSLEETRDWLKRSLESWRTGHGHRPWLFEPLEGGGPIGAVGITVEAHRANLGYSLSRARWGEGLTTEAARAVVGSVASLPGVQRVWSVCDVDNVASARVLEKVGMQLEGVLARWVVHPALSDRPRDVCCYVLPSP